MSLTYNAWIKKHGTSERKCAEKTLEMQEVFPELRRVRGHFVTLTDKYQHWWLVSPDGEVVDPTRSQFPESGYYEPYSGPEPTGRCLECGQLCFEGRDFCRIECERSFRSSLGV